MLHSISIRCISVDFDRIFKRQISPNSGLKRDVKIGAKKGDFFSIFILVMNTNFNVKGVFDVKTT